MLTSKMLTGIKKQHTTPPTSGQDKWIIPIASICVSSRRSFGFHLSELNYLCFHVDDRNWTKPEIDAGNIK